MKKIIRFTKLRFLAFIFSALLIAGGLVGLVLRGGFNLSIDFTGGINKQFQIAPASFSLFYAGEGDAEVNIYANEMTVSLAGANPLLFNFENYDTVQQLLDALSEIPGIEIELLGEPNVPTQTLITLNYPVDIATETLVVNRAVSAADDLTLSIQEVRQVLDELDSFSLQIVGNPLNQEFILKKPTPEDPDNEFLQRIDSQINDLLAARYGQNSIVQKKTEFVDPIFSLDLIRGAIWALIVAFLLILIYITVRFKIYYAAAAIIALIHDISIMIGVIIIFQLEVTSATIAAVLTIIGYSLNDTIVVFDRVRENTLLMPDAGRKEVIDTSITQSLGRTTITSLTTLLAVIAIYIFTNAIRDFSFSLIIGIVVGTYSSIFIASPVVLGWQNAFAKTGRTRKRDSVLSIVRPEEDRSGESAPEKEQNDRVDQFKLVLQERKKPLKKKKKRKRR